jgi:virulence-associated protein VapD
MTQTLNGFELEEWVKAFAKKSGILNEKPFIAEQTIVLFSNKLNQRLSWARTEIDKAFIDSDKWLDQAINNQPIKGVSEQVKNDFINKLADLVMATDLVVQLKNSAGKNVKIAVDVTSNKKELEDKLRKVKGYPTKNMVSKANKNIPEVRSELGIDKHLILLLNRTKTLLPSHATLLNAIYTFAESPTITRAVDLSNLELKDRYNWRVEYEADPERMWEKYTQSFNTKSTAVLGLEVAKQTLRENHTPKAVLNMLTQDPQYREYLRRDGGDRTRADRYAQGILAKAQAELEQSRVNDANQIAHGINRVLAKFGKEQKDGSVVFEGNTLRFTASASEMTVENTKSGAITFHIKDGQLLKHNVNSDLKAKVTALKRAMQEQTLQEGQNIGERNTVRKGR